MLRYKINKISEVENDLLSEFYKKIYQKRHNSLSNNWRWWYRVGHNEFEPIVILVDNKIIGHAGLLPIDLNILGKKIPAIWFVDFVIIPEFQGKGFGQILTKEWMKICPNQITFCNNQSLKIFKKFGWKNNLSTKRFLRPINFFKITPVTKKIKLDFADSVLRYFIKKKYNKNISINPYPIESNFKSLNEAFKLKKYQENTEFAQIIRDEQWLYWRLMECPYKKDIFFFEYKNNFSIVHVYSVKNIKRLNILYTFHTESLHENALVMMIVKWAINNNIDLMWAINKGKEFDNIFPKIFNKSIRYAAWSSDEKIFETIQKGLLDFQGIDSDKESSTFIEN